MSGIRLSLTLLKVRESIDAQIMTSIGSEGGFVNMFFALKVCVCKRRIKENSLMLKALFNNFCEMKLRIVEVEKYGMYGEE